MSYRFPSVLGLLLVCLVGACGHVRSGSGDGSTSESAAAFEAELIQAMVGKEEGALRPTLTLAEMYPGVGQSKVVADAFRADVVGVDAGRAFNNFDENFERTPLQEVPFDDPRADWRSFEVRVKVAEVYWGDVTAGTELALGLTFNAQTELTVVSEGFASMGEVVVFTATGDFVVPYDPTIIPVLWDGAFLTPVEGERVPWPVLSEPGSGAPVVPDLDTLAELRQLK